MPRTRRLLDSSPVELPASKPRPPRRAAAALAALPTPPRTQTKRKRASATPKASRATDSDDDEEQRALPTIDEERDEDVLSGDHSTRRAAEGAVFVGHKKRKTLDALVAELSEQTAEDDFWLGPSTSSSKTVGPKPDEDSRSRSRQRSATPIRSPSSSPPAALRRRKKQGSGLLSPPPSRRQTRLSQAPATPPPRPVSRSSFRHLPERDSPNNPFLVESTPGSDVESPPPLPVTPLPHVERPTLTYVFRGTKAYFRNPLYKSPGDPSEEDDRSLLPENHQEYSPSSACPPKLLWPDARTRDHARLPRHKAPESSRTAGRSKRSRRDPSKERIRSEWDSTDDEQEPKAPPPAVKRDIPPVDDSTVVLENVLAERIARRGVATVDVSQELPRTRTRSHNSPRLPPKDRSDPVRRAVGPVRPSDA